MDTQRVQFEGVGTTLLTPHTNLILDIGLIEQVSDVGWPMGDISKCAMLLKVTLISPCGRQRHQYRANLIKIQSSRV